MTQEAIALAIVALTAGFLILQILRTYLAPPLALWLLRRGRAKLAFWVKKQAPSRKGACRGCKSC